jgi:hypothetical protein
LEGEREEPIKETDLLVDLLPEESEPELFRADCSPEPTDAVPADILDVVDGWLGTVEGEGEVLGGEELSDMVDSRRIVGKDDDVIEVGKNNERGRGKGERGGEVCFEGGEGVASGEGEKEGERRSPWWLSLKEGGEGRERREHINQLTSFSNEIEVKQSGHTSSSRWSSVETRPEMSLVKGSRPCIHCLQNKGRTGLGIVTPQKRQKMTRRKRSGRQARRRVGG